MRISDWSSDVCSSDLLGSALKLVPEDARAWYLLGNLWYDKRQYDDAISCWERSVAENQEFPTAHRNLSLAWHNKRNDRVRALASLEKAFDLDREDARVLMELDQLYKLYNQPIQQRNRKRVVEGKSG